MMSASSKCYRDVPMCPSDAMVTAAAYLEREWGSGRVLGYVGPDGQRHGGNVVYAFQCMAGDGSRWLIWATAYGHCGSYTRETEARIAYALSVEVN